ncbi:MAG: radical SAM protein [Candidatus Saliniplasma sp.]
MKEGNANFIRKRVDNVTRDGENIVKKIAYGPVPSRRLGQSMGINNIPPKICTYSCVYCQLGKTLTMRVYRDDYYSIDEIVKSVQNKLNKALKNQERIDYLTFVPDGEPTLDINLGDEIEVVKELGYKVAVISNASLIGDEQVRYELSKADWVSLKIDAVSPQLWKKINRPHRDLDVDQIINGIYNFSDLYLGELNTETMLVDGINDGTEELKKIAEKISDIGVDKSYISIPTRPPAEGWVNSPDEDNINEAYNIFRETGIDVEYLIGYEGNAFASSGNIREDLLSITAVHPMRERQVKKLLSKTDDDWNSVQELIQEEKLIVTEYKGEKFYMRKLS